MMMLSVLMLLSFVLASLANILSPLDVLELKVKRKDLKIELCME